VFGGDRHNGDHFEVNLQRLLDSPTDTFDIFRGVRVPPGRYWWSRLRAAVPHVVRPSPKLQGVCDWGRFYSGRSTDLELSAVWRGGAHLIVSTDLIRTTAQLPVGAFTALLSLNRFEYDFNTRTSLLAFVQYDNEKRTGRLQRAVPLDAGHRRRRLHSVELRIHDLPWGVVRVPEQSFAHTPLERGCRESRRCIG